MQKELEMKLTEIDAELEQLAFPVSDEQFGRKFALQEMKQWIEGLIINFCD